MITAQSEGNVLIVSNYNYVCSVTLINLRTQPEKRYIWSMALYGAENWTLRQAYQKYLESFKMSCWRKMEKIVLADCVKSEEVLHTIKKERNILHTITRRRSNWIGHIVEVMDREGGRCKQLLNDLKETTGY
jgi:hypothetical protein